MRCDAGESACPDLARRGPPTTAACLSSAEDGTAKQARRGEFLLRPQARRGSGNTGATSTPEDGNVDVTMAEESW